MNDEGTVSLVLNGARVTAKPGETIWQVAKRAGVEIEHLCYRPHPDYRPDGNCRACLVEVQGERTLAASCRRHVTAGMVIDTHSARARNARRMVLAMLRADHPDCADEPASPLGRWSDGAVPLPPSSAAGFRVDATHRAIRFSETSCIRCGLCIRACREVQGNAVIGWEGRGADTRIVFDLGDPLAESTCVACGECIDACPTGALAPVHGAKTADAHATKRSLCPFCGVGCQIDYIVDDGRIVRAVGADGPSNRGRLCVKGRFGFDYTHSPERLTTPLIRREGAAKAPDAIPPRARRLDAFRPASWDEALAFAARGLKQAADQGGGRAVAGFGSAKGSNEEAYLFQKLLRAGFNTNNVDHCTRLCHASSVTALLEGLGSGAVTAPFMAVRDADFILIVGARPESNHPVAASFFKNAAMRGARLVVVDPRRQNLARFGTQLQIRSGSDIALLNALLYTVIDEGLVDASYVADHVDGFDDLKASLAPFAPEAMADATGIDAETIRRTARDYAKAERAIIFWGMGLSQHVHGTDNVRALIALALVTGQIGRPGTGLHPLRGQNNVQGASDAGLIPMYFPDYQAVADPSVRDRFARAWGVAPCAEPGLTVVEILDAAAAGDIKAMYVMGENPAMSDPDAAHARAALAALDHLVVQDIFLTETAWLADVILPATSFYEKTGTYTNTNRQVQFGRAVVAPPGGARADLDIIVDIAGRVGLDWRYEGPGAVFGEMQTVMPSLAGITWDMVAREGSVVYPRDPATGQSRDILFANGFPTASGRARIVPAEPAAPTEPPDADFPYVLTTGRHLEHWHTGAMTRTAAILDALEPIAYAAINPSVLAEHGIAPGGRIAVTSRRGEIELVARADGDVPPGMVFIPFCYAEAAANVLTNPALDPYGKIPGFKACAVDIRPV